jgi:hypothetical protein
MMYMFNLLNFGFSGIACVRYVGNWHMSAIGFSGIACVRYVGNWHMSAIGFSGIACMLAWGVTDWHTYYVICLTY